MLKILNLTTFDSGGAGSYALQINEMLNTSGYFSKLVVRYSENNDSNIIAVESRYNTWSFAWLLKKAIRFLKKRKNGISRKKPQTLFDFYFFQDEQDEYVSAVNILKRISFKPDIILIYWVSEFITSKTINDLRERTGAQIIWLMMDNAPITGGCHYPWDCKGYQSDCSNCPAIVEKKNLVKAQVNLALKKKNLPPELIFVAFSEQDYQRAKKSSLYPARTLIKQLGFIDEKKFIPGNKLVARAHFGINPECKVLFFGASKMNEKRKGMDLLIKVFQSLNTYFEEKQVVLLYAGYQIPPTIEAITLKHLGFLDEKELILAYQAADIFVCPSIEDSGPMMINQSILCGTPVVAFEIGVATDLVINNQTGYRARLYDIEDFMEGIKSMLDLAPSIQEIYAKNCRETGLMHMGLSSFRKFFNEMFIKE